MFADDRAGAREVTEAEVWLRTLDQASYEELAEADALARAGNTVDARGVLRHASDVADAATSGLLPVGEAGAFLDLQVRDRRARDRDEGADEGDGDESPPSVAQSREVIRKVRDAVHEAKDLIDQD